MQCREYQNQCIPKESNQWHLETKHSKKSEQWHPLLASTLNLLGKKNQIDKFDADWSN